MRTKITLISFVMSVAVAVSAQEGTKNDSGAVPASDRRPQSQAKSLTIRECVELALRNNLDISIRRIGLGLADTSILSERSTFEPNLQLSSSFQSSSSPNLGLPSTRSERIQSTFAFEGRTPTGLVYSLQANSTDSASSLSGFDDEYSAFTGLTLTQPLFKNAWRDVNLSGIQVARKSRQIADEDLATQLNTTVTTVQKAYYDLVFAIENLKVQRESLALAEELLEQNRTRLKAGVMSPLDVTQAEASAATNLKNVIAAERAVKDQENVLKQLISRDVASLRTTTLVPVDAPSIVEVPLDVSESIRTALKRRPDYLQAELEAERRGLLLRYARNQLYPEIDLLASYGFNGLDRGFGSSFGKAFEGDDPQWSLGLIVKIPLGNQKARADHQSATLQREQALLALKRVEQIAIVEVDNATGQAETNFKRIEAARVARRLAEEQLAAEKKKLAAGTSTSFFVLQFQKDLAQARADEIRAILDYNKSLSDLYNAEGTTLERAGIQIKDK